MSAIRVELELDDGSFTSRLIHAGESVDQFAQNVGQGIQSISRMERESEGLLSSLRDLTVTLAVAGHAIHNLQEVTTGWAGEIIKVNAEFERMTALMRQMSTAADPMKDATQTIGALRDQAKDAPFGLQAMHDAFIRLKSAGIDPMAGSLHALTDAVAAFGGGDENLHRAALAIQEMSSKGVVQMKELRNQLGMAIPNSLPLLARALGVSYEELMSDVHTGTVDAANVIRALQGEFERTFGGAGQRQMQTFNGQIAQMQVNLQKLAVENVGRPGQGGYFDAVKAQVVDLNTFLESSTAQGLGNMLGDGLVRAVEDLRDVVDLAARFKDEIMAAGEAWAYAFAAKAAVDVVGGVVGQVKNLGKEITLVSTAWNVMSDRMAAARLLNSTQMMGAPMLGGMAAAGRIAGSAVSFLGVAIGTVLPWLAILGPALAAAAEYFGVFHDKAQEGYESLQRFGAQTEAEARKADDYIASLDRRIASLKELKKAHDGVSNSWMAGDMAGLGDTLENGDDIQHQIDEVTKQRDIATAALPGFHEQGLANAAKAFVGAQMNLFAQQQAMIEANYDQQSRIAQEAYGQQMKDLTAAHRSTAAVTEAYQAAQREREIANYQAQEDALKEYLDKAKTLRETNNSDQAKRNGSALEADVNKRLVELGRQRLALQAQQPGVQLDAKIVDENKLFEKGTQELQKMRDAAFGFAAGLEGLDPKVAELQAALEHGFKFGDIGVDRVRDLINQMVEAKAQADALNEAMKGNEKFNNQLTSLREGLDERLEKARNGGLTDSDQLRIKAQDGMFAGVGPNRAAVDKVLAEVESHAQRADQATQGFGKTLTSQVQPAAEKLADTFKTIADTVAGIKTPAIPAPGAGIFTGTSAAGSGPVSSPMLALMSQFVTKGVDPGTAAGFVAGTSMESGKGLDPTANNGSHLGVAQWDATRWRALQDRLGAGAMAGQQGQFNGIFLELGTNESKAGGLLASGKGIAAGIGASDAYERPGDAEAARRRPEALSRANALMSAWLAAGGTDFAAMGAQSRGLTKDQDAKLTADADYEKNTVIPAENAAKLGETVTMLGQDALKAGMQIDESRKHYAALIADIKTGVYTKNGIGSTDPNDPQFKNAIDAANKADAAEKATADAKKARTEAETAIADLRKDITAIQAERAQTLATIGRNGSRDSADALRAKGQDANTIEKAKATGNADLVAQAQQLAAEREQALNDQSFEKTVEGLGKKTTALRQALMTQEDAQQDAYDKEVNRLQKGLDAYRGTAEQKEVLAKQVSDYEAAYAAKQAASSPLAKEFQQWSDLTKNAQQMTANWMNSTVDDISTMVVKGKADWKSLTDSMLSDLLKLSIHGALGGLGTAAKGTGGSFFSSLFGSWTGGGGAAGVGHNASGTSDWGGGLTWVGEKGPELVSLPGGSSIAPAGSVPAMAQQGANSSSAAMAQMNITSGDTTTNHIQIAPVLQASGGTPQQNADLAAQMGKHVEDAARRVFASEVRQQMRPGGMLDGTSFSTR